MGRLPDVSPTSAKPAPVTAVDVRRSAPPPPAVTLGSRLPRTGRACVRDGSRDGRQAGTSAGPFPGDFPSKNFFFSFGFQTMLDDVHACSPTLPGDGDPPAAVRSSAAGPPPRAGRNARCTLPPAPLVTSPRKIFSSDFHQGQVAMMFGTGENGHQVSARPTEGSGQNPVRCRRKFPVFGATSDFGPLRLSTSTYRRSVFWRWELTSTRVRRYLNR